MKAQILAFVKAHAVAIIAFAVGFVLGLAL